MKLTIRMMIVTPQGEPTLSFDFTLDPEREYPWLHLYTQEEADVIINPNRQSTRDWVEMRARVMLADAMRQHTGQEGHTRRVSRCVYSWHPRR